MFSDLPEFAIDQLMKRVREKSLPPDWIWAQFQNEEVHGTQGPVWVSRATQLPLVVTPTFGRTELEKRYLACILFPDAASKQEAADFVSATQGQAATAPWNGGVRRRQARIGSGTLPLPSLISSFRTRGYSDAARHWPRLSDNTSPRCELYALMQTEVDRRLEQRVGFSYKTAFGYMADNAGNSPLIAEIAHDIARPTRFSHDTIPIIGLATFLPAISSPRGSTSAAKFCSTATFVAQLASQLRSPRAPGVRDRTGVRLDD